MGAFEAGAARRVRPRPRERRRSRRCARGPGEGRSLSAGPGKRRLRLLITINFSNERQARAHFEPLLALDEIEEATLVADAPGPALPKLHTVVPPRLLVRLLGRAGAKGVLCLLVARRSRPDWIVCYSLVPHGLNAWLVARLARVPRVLYHMIGGPREWEGGGWTSDNRLVGRLRRPVPALERALLAVIRSYTAVVTMGELGRRRLIENGIPAERVVAVPPSVDAETFHPRAGGERRYHLVTVGALIARKRTQDLVEAVARLRPGRPELRAAVVGTGPLEEHLRAEAARLGVPDAVDFLGRRDDVEDVYAASEIFVLTSRDEGLSVAQIEAMASGLPAVVSDVGEAADLLRDGRNGYLFAAGDVETLVARLALLLDEPDLRRRMGAAAAEDARAHAGRERVSSLYRDLFRRLGE